IRRMVSLSRFAVLSPVKAESAPSRDAWPESPGVAPASVAGTSGGNGGAGTRGWAGAAGAWPSHRGRLTSSDATKRKKRGESIVAERNAIGVYGWGGTGSG